MKEIWSVFSRDMKDEKETTLTNKITLYKGDLSGVILEDDWRFKTVKGKRENTKFLGLIADPVFPLEFPLKYE